MAANADELLDWHRRFCKAQRERLRYRFRKAEARVREARLGALEEWDRMRPAAGKKPGLDYYDARWR